MAIKTIYKYEVPGKIKGKIKRFLQPQMQYGQVMIWAELDSSLPEREFIATPIGTGWEIERGDGMFDIMENGIYCGTVMDDPYVWHVYVCEIPNDSEI